MVRIRCFSRKVKISKGVGKNIEKAYKIVLFCKNLFKNNDFSLVKQ